MSVTFGGYVDAIHPMFCNRSRHFSAQAGNVFAFTPDISQSKSASEDIIRLLDAKPEIDSESSEGKTLEEVTGRVELRDVHFRYPTRPTVRVLRGFNLTVEPGTHAALVGASGCGKSTVVQVSPCEKHCARDSSDTWKSSSSSGSTIHCRVLSL